MPGIQRIALGLLSFAFIGLGLIAWQPQGHARIAERPVSYLIAISAGAGLRLADSGAALPDEPILSCDQIYSVGPIEIGTRCTSHGWDVTINR